MKKRINMYKHMQMFLHTHKFCLPCSNTPDPPKIKRPTCVAKPAPTDPSYRSFSSRLASTQKRMYNKNIKSVGMDTSNNQSKTTSAIGMDNRNNQSKSLSVTSCNQSKIPCQ